MTRTSHAFRSLVAIVFATSFVACSGGGSGGGTEPPPPPPPPAPAPTLAFTSTGSATLLLNDSTTMTYVATNATSVTCTMSVWYDSTYDNSTKSKCTADLSHAVYSPGSGMPKNAAGTGTDSTVVITIKACGVTLPCDVKTMTVALHTPELDVTKMTLVPSHVKYGQSYIIKVQSTTPVFTTRNFVGFEGTLSGLGTDQLGIDPGIHAGFGSAKEVAFTLTTAASGPGEVVNVSVRNDKGKIVYLPLTFDK